MKRFLLPAIFLFHFVTTQTAPQTYMPDHNFEQTSIDLGYDDLAYSEAAMNWRKDEGATYSEDCSDMDALGTVTNIQELTTYNGNFFFHDINRDFGEYTFWRNDPEKQDPTETPFLLDNSQIIAHTEGDKIESVKFYVDITYVTGDRHNTYTIIDNEPPYTIDNRLTEGSVHISATPYSEDDAKGLEGVSFTASFYLIDYYNEFQDNLTLTDFTNNSTIIELISVEESAFSIDKVEGKKINFEVTDKIGDPSPFYFEIEGPNMSISNERYFGTSSGPFLFFEDDGILLEVGDYKVKAIPLDLTDKRPSLDIAWNFTITESEALQTHVPDDNFEQALIDLGYDDVLDDYVLTANIKSVTRLEINGNNIQDLTGVNDFISLENLDLENNQLTSIDVSKLAALNTLNLSRNLITNIDISNNLKLVNLYLENNQIKNIDLSANAVLHVLHLNNNMLHRLDVSNNPELGFLDFRSNDIETLDLSKNPKLINVEGAQNRLTFINLKNGNNASLVMIVNSNQAGLCIQVDDLSVPNTWFKDDSAQYSLDCSTTSEDSDNDGISDDLDICPNTAEGQNVNIQGCSLSQYADAAIQNVSIGLGTFLCSEPQNCTVDLAVLRDVDITVSVVKDNNENIFDGVVDISSPLSLENLTTGEYNVCATRSDIPNFVQCYQVSSTSTTNSISTTIVMQNPDQVYTLAVEGNKKYEVLVNGTSTIYEFDSVEKQSLEIPLEVGRNTIQIIGEIECDVNTSDEIEGDDGSKNSDNLLLFPTLSDGLITLENNKQHQIHGITVTGLNGATNKYMPINGNPKEIEIDMRSVAKGMYIVRIQLASGEVNLIKIMLR